MMTNKQSSATASVLFSDDATLFSYPTSGNISGVFCWIYLDWSHGMTRHDLSMFFGRIIGLSLVIDSLTQGGAVIQTCTPNMLHVAHWRFLFLVGRVWISCLMKMRHCVFYITSRVLMFPSVAATKPSITLMIKHSIDMEIHLTVYVEAYHIFSVHHFQRGAWQHYNVVLSTNTQIMCRENPSLMKNYCKPDCNIKQGQCCQYLFFEYIELYHVCMHLVYVLLSVFMF